MNPTGRGFWDAVAGHGFTATQADFEHARLVLNEKPHGLAAEFPLAGELGDGEVGFEGCVGG